MVAATENEQSILGLSLKSLIEVQVYFQKTVQLNIYGDQTDGLQLIVANIINSVLINVYIYFCANGSFRKKIRLI